MTNYEQADRLDAWTWVIGVLVLVGLIVFAALNLTRTENVSPLDSVCYEIGGTPESDKGDWICRVPGGMAYSG